jgi:two-component system response regulator VicR
MRENKIKARIMVIQDGSSFDPAIASALIAEGFGLSVADDITTCYKALLEVRPDVIVIRTAGWSRAAEELLVHLRNLRFTRHARTIALVSSACPNDIALALECGADDVLRFPISPREFLARITAALRSYPPQELKQERQLGNLRLRRDEMDVFVSGKQKTLTPTEFNLLAFLMDNPREVITREVLLENLWPPFGEIETPRIVDVYVMRVREKIEDNPAEPRILITKWGQGYCLVDPRVNLLDED